MTAARFQRLRQVLMCRQPDLTIVTDNVHKGRNLSAIVRTADAAGIGKMHCSMPDKDYKAFRGTAMGSHSWVSVDRHPDVKTALTPLKNKGYQVLAAHLAEDSVDFREADYTRPTVILLGAEKKGVSAAGCELADMHITIPMRGMVQSFNVSVAAGIILAEAERQRQLAGMYSQRRIDDDCYHQTLFEWAQPKLSDYCRQHDLAYPALDDEGELLDGLSWQREVRKGSAPRCNW
ncbi:tRNA (guanosine(18)-2'-O)-methyltransferase [Zhongshania aliphaticivorans]|uniref:tRNA (guanosine(18)-2'-O)-methyltransferase n=1 Tax=Zhongshania aliphaticivorans TaxID=1470434 RepID=A0A5S9NTF4_9GAMM|nr:tRNA (guanosine(18)-2'-O)-methyltransferase TrmH [Zhongshania aliphaticivorans]CAA0093879.1 tRNA (guanosine(18)-2'-O)-methyltransferase [Zhongshania aliphaticivorans]CAA0111958.1 tRNA (guanosine(18)-2'-O)-methyltransferase [Zhongshania aliphaticivorans]